MQAPHPAIVRRLHDTCSVVELYFDDSPRPELDRLFETCSLKLQILEYACHFLYALANEWGVMETIFHTA